MKVLVLHHATTGATNAARAFTKLSIPATVGIGPTVTINERYTNLAEVLKKVSLSSGIGWTVYLDLVSSLMVFQVINGIDRRASQKTNPRAIFSVKWDTLKSGNLTETNENYRNTMIVAGQGTGASRKIRYRYSGGTESSDEDRYEEFIDARDINANADLDARGDQAITQMDAQRVTDCQVITDGALVLGVDYDLGDLVTTEIYDVAQDQRISLVRETWGGNNSPQYQVDLEFDKQAPSVADAINASAGESKAALAKVAAVPGATTGSNANGYWTKTPTGTGVGMLEQWGLSAELTTATVIVAGVLYYGSLVITFPIQFSAKPDSVQHSTMGSVITYTWAAGVEGADANGYTAIVESNQATGRAKISWRAKGFYTE
jgi:hypothetical protein